MGQPSGFGITFDGDFDVVWFRRLRCFLGVEFLDAVCGPVVYLEIRGVGGGVFFDDFIVIIALCGGENVFGDVTQLTPAVSLEAVIAARPEAILGGGSAEGEKEFNAQWRAHAVPPLRGLPAHYINPDLIQRQTPRIVEGARAVCSALEQVRKNRIP